VFFSAKVRVPAVALSGLVRRKEGFEVTTDPGGDRAFAVHGPRNHRAVIDVLDEAREFGSVAGAEFTGRDGFIEERFCFGADGAELCQGDGVKVGIGEVNLQVREAVGYRLGGGGEAGAIGVEFDQSFKRRGMFRAAGGELLRDGCGGGTTHGKQQTALSAEALD